MQTTKLVSAACALALAGGLAQGATIDRFPTPLPVDTGLTVRKLPAEYPKGWAFLAYSNDKFELRDVGSDERAVEGHLPGHESATLLVSNKRPELYVADTVWARGNRGPRTDFITIYDKQTLLPVGEVVLPKAKRALVVPMQGMFSFAADEQLATVFNFTPAASVTVVDLVRRKVLSEVAIPGCTLAFPSGPRGFATLCGNGTLLNVQLDAKGSLASQTESAPFNLLDEDPLFTTSAVANGIRYFPSFFGRIQPLDLRGAEAKILPDWSLVSPEEAAANWRPSGNQLITSGDDGRLYVIMQPNAHEGTHKDAGTEVWVFDPASRTRVARIRLVRPASSIEVTHDREPLLLVASREKLDVYELPHGSFVRSLDMTGGHRSVLIEAVR
ncbi:MAG: amine dehydrogenase [Proteobacteria bacterium]|nr:amine dehydrogenase [Pseudomonadota bacterium]